MGGFCSVGRAWEGRGMACLRRVWSPGDGLCLGFFWFAYRRAEFSIDDGPG